MSGALRLALARLAARFALRVAELLVGREPFNAGDSRLVDRAVDLVERVRP